MLLGNTGKQVIGSAELEAPGMLERLTGNGHVAAELC